MKLYTQVGFTPHWTEAPVIQLPPNKICLLVDVSPISHAVKHRCPTLNAQQMADNICTSVREIMSSCNPDYLVMVKEGGNHIRAKITAKYKDGRAERYVTDEDKAAEQNRREAVDMLNEDRFPGTYVSIPGYEADDVIGAYARALTCKVIIASNDGDMAQLLQGDKVTMVDTLKRVYVTARGFEKKQGYPAHYVPLFKANVGDKSDNITGTAGIGAVRAREFLTGDCNDKTLDTIMADADGICDRLDIIGLPLPGFPYELLPVPAVLPDTEELLPF